MEKRIESESEVPANVRLRYWLGFVRGKHRREMELLLGEAKLGKKPRKVGDRWEGWKHQAAEAAAMRVLGEALQLPEEQILRQENFAFIHDAEKHAGVFQAKRAAGKDMSDWPKSETFTPEEEAAMEQKFTAMRNDADPDGSLATATNEAFFYKIFEQTPGRSIEEKLGNLTQAELLQYFVDSIFVDGNLVPALERIAKTEARRQDLNEDPERTRRLGMKYWDAERLVAMQVEAKIVGWLQEKGVQMPAGGITKFLHKSIEQNMIQHWLEVHGEQSVVTDVEKNSKLNIETVCDTRRMNESGELAPEKNEDTGIVRQQGNIVIAGIFDGATNIGAPMPISPGKAAAVACREAIAAAPLASTPRQMLLQANAMLRGVAAGLPLSPEERSEVLSAVGAVAKLDLSQGSIEVASIADSHIVVLHKDGTSTWLTQNTSEHCERLEIAAAVWGAEHPREPLAADAELLANLDRVMTLPPEQRPAIKPLEDERVLDVIARNRRLENDLPNGGQPSLKGSDDEQMAIGIQEDSAQVASGDQVFLFTDGGYPGPLFTTAQQEEVTHILRVAGISGLQTWVYAREEADPELRNPPRMKQYDDLVAMQILVP